MEQNFTAISHRIGEPQGPLHSGADPENYAPRAPSGPVTVGLSYPNSDRGNWNYRISFQLPGAGGENPPPQTSEDEGYWDDDSWEDPNLRRPTENFSYTLTRGQPYFGESFRVSGPDDTDEDDGDLSGGGEETAPIGFGNGTYILENRLPGSNKK